ncbi:MAG: hypothetical protein OQL28_03625 [Sedimenticola sp.]|nr:hypothetical protein [Sedimenticola sp.]
MSGRYWVILAGLWLVGCSEPPPPPTDPLQRELDIARERMHQTREVIRYMEIQQRLEREMREPLSDPASASPTKVEPAGRE